MSWLGTFGILGLIVIGAVLFCGWVLDKDDILEEDDDERWWV